MLRIFVPDLGKQTGWAILEGSRAESGSLLFVEKWWPDLGGAAVEYDRKMRDKIAEARPDVLAIATQFVSRRDTTQNSLPLFWAYGNFLKMAHEMGLPCEIINEGEARSKMLGKDVPMPRGSEAKKRAIWQACRDRGWYCSDHNCSDALCVALAAQERLDPENSYRNTPLFRSAPHRRKSA